MFGVTTCGVPIREDFVVCCGVSQREGYRVEDQLMILANLVTHVLYDTFEWGGHPISSIGRSFGDLQVKET